MSIAAVVTRGYGSGGSISLVTTRGYVGSATVPVVIRGRRRRTRRYVAPSRDALKSEFSMLAEAAPEQVREAVAEHLKLGRQPERLSSRYIDWEALYADAHAVSRLLDIWIEYVQEEDDVTILLMEF